MKIKTVKLLILLLILAAESFAFFGILPVRAQSDADSLLWGGFETNIQEATGLGNEDPRQIAARIINILLGFLGVIAVIIIVLGGFKWMVSGGQEDRADEAKRMIGSGILGLILILAAFGIAQFVLNSLFSATNALG